jgi:hypothetical protein
VSMVRDQADDALSVAWSHSRQPAKAIVSDLLGVGPICQNSPFLREALVVAVPLVPGLRE